MSITTVGQVVGKGIRRVPHDRIEILPVISLFRCSSPTYPPSIKKILNFFIFAQSILWLRKIQPQMKRYICSRRSNCISQRHLGMINGISWWYVVMVNRFGFYANEYIDLRHHWRRTPSICKGALSPLNFTAGIQYICTTKIIDSEIERSSCEACFSRRGTSATRSYLQHCRSGKR